MLQKNFLKRIINALKNYFNIEGKTYVLMVAFYDETGKLINVEVTDKKGVNFDETSEETSRLIPKTPAKVKPFFCEERSFGIISIILYATASSSVEIFLSFNNVSAGNSQSDI